MFNPNYRNLLDEAKFALYEGALKFDELRHKSAVNYLGNYVREHLKHTANEDRDQAFPGITIVHPPKPKDDEEELDIFDVSPDGYLRPLEASPETHAILGNACNHVSTKVMKETRSMEKPPSMIKVVIDIQEHPYDISITSIAERTGLPKSTVSDAFKKIIKILRNESRTNLN